MSEVKALADLGRLVVPGENVLMLTGSTTDGAEFTGAQTITVINVEPAGSGGKLAHAFRDIWIKVVESSRPLSQEFGLSMEPSRLNHGSSIGLLMPPWVDFSLLNHDALTYDAPVCRFQDPC